MLGKDVSWAFVKQSVGEEAGGVSFTVKIMSDLRLLGSESVVTTPFGDVTLGTIPNLPEIQFPR